MGNITLLYLKSRRLYLNNHKRAAILVKKYMRVVYGCEIPFTCNIAESVHFAHNALGVVINERAVIGENCTIYQNVTIGNRNGSDAPKIGNNVLIGAGAIVVHDVPPNTTVVQETAKYYPSGEKS